MGNRAGIQFGALLGRMAVGARSYGNVDFSGRTSHHWQHGSFRPWLGHRGESEAVKVRFVVKAVRQSERSKAAQDPTYTAQEYVVGELEAPNRKAADWKCAFNMACLLYPPYSRVCEEVPEEPKEENK